MKKTCTAFCHLTVFLLSRLLSLAVFTPSPSVREMLISGQRTWKIVLGAWSAMKKHLHPPLNMAPELEDKKKKNNGKEKNKLPYQSLGEEVGNTYAHPWFLPGRPPRNHFLLSSRSNSEPHLLKWKCSWECLWKGRASCRWDESNPRATVLELLTVVFKNIKEYSCFEGGKITLNFVCKCFNGAYVIRVNYQEPVYINP